MRAFKNIFRIVTIVSVTAFVSSCEDKIELDLPEGETFLVVEGFITTTDRPHDILLTYTSPYFDDSPQPKVTGATVILRDNEGAEITLPEEDPGVYTYPTAGEIGKSYQLEIFLADGEHYRSTYEELAEVVEIDSIAWRLSEDEPDLDDGQSATDIYEVLIWTIESPGVGDYYRWRGFLNGIEYQAPEDLFYASDEFVDGNPIPEFNVTDELYSIGDTVKIIQERVQRGQYEFLNLLFTQTAFVGGPFDNPPAPVTGNITNVDDPNKFALGYFGTAAQSFAEIVVGE